MIKVYVDFETYSEEPIKSAGMYRYTQHPSFEIMLIGYAIEDGPVKIVDLLNMDDSSEFRGLIMRNDVLIVAHNAAFERLCLDAIGISIPPIRFMCTASKSLYSGFPEKLAIVSEVLKLKEGKLGTGLALIKLFCVPQKDGSRVWPWQHPEKWEEFKEYLKYDVLSEREIDKKLSHIIVPRDEIELAALDQEINDRGMSIDQELARAADSLYKEYLQRLTQQINKAYGITSLKSGKQLQDFIKRRTGIAVPDLQKTTVATLLKEVTDPHVKRVLEARKLVYFTSIAKYAAMLDCVCADGRIRGLYRYYGANRTGRFAGRMVQTQNLTKNFLDPIEQVRKDIKTMELDDLILLYSNVPYTLSQLIRTAFVAPKGKIFRVADFSAIEARVLACLAGETWRVDVFKHNGDIYVTSAARTFNMDESECGKHTPWRAKGKVTELALGYGGWVGAIKQMDTSHAIPEEDIKNIILKWRDASPKIVALWRLLEDTAKRVVSSRSIKPRPVIVDGRTVCSFSWLNEFSALVMTLPSGRSLYYPGAYMRHKTITYDNGDSREVECVSYQGMDQTSGKWVTLDTYGGKLCENLTQAVARDLLTNGLRNVDELPQIGIVGHVHDEVIAEDDDNDVNTIEDVCEAMCILPEWAKVFDMPLNAEGFNSYFYKKD